jgi:hypothetical protein
MLKFKDYDEAKINSAYSPPQKIQDDRKRIYERYADMKNGRNYNGQNIEAVWDSAEKQYEGWRPPKSEDDWQSNIVPPITTTLVERALGEVSDQTIQPTVTARGEEDVVRARLMDYTYQYTWEKGDGDLELYAGLKQAFVLGNTVWQDDYWRDRRIVKVLKKFDMENNEEEYVQKKVDDFDDVYGETVNLREFYIDPNARSINRGRYKANDCIRRYIYSYNSFMEEFKGSIYDEFGACKYVTPGGDTDFYQFYQPPHNINKDQVEVLFYWGRRPDKLIIVANDIVVRDGPNPYNHKQLPFAWGRDIPKMNTLLARGEPNLLESIQDEMSTIRRMRIDRQHMDIWKMFLVSNRENLDDDEAVIAPSRFMYVDDPNNSIKPIEYNPVHATAYEEEKILKQEAREVTGMESPQTTGTATQAAIFKEATMKSLRMKIWLLSRELLTDIVRLRVPNITQFYSTPKVEQIVGEKNFGKYRTIRTSDMQLKVEQNGKLIENPQKGSFFFELTPDMVTPQYGSFDYKLSGGPTFPISKPLQQQKVAEFMQHPVITGAIQAGYYELGRMADEFSKIMEYDPDKFKNPESEQAQPQFDEETMLEMASRENALMMEGQKIDETPYATRGHTNIHLAFMESPTFRQGFNEEIMRNFIYHIQGEEKEQEQRQKANLPNVIPGSQVSGTPPPTESQGIMAGQAAAMTPGMAQGGENAPPPPEMPRNAG